MPNHKLLQHLIRWALWSPTNWFYARGPQAMPSLPISWLSFSSIALLAVASHFIPIPALESPISSVVIIEILSLVLCLLILKVGLHWHGLSWNAIGLSRQKLTREILIGLGVFLPIALAQIAYNSLMGLPPYLRWLSALSYAPWFWFLQLAGWLLQITAQAVAVGISEEAVFRGWIVTFLLTHLISRERALWISAVIFGLVHINQSLQIALGAVAFGYIFGLLYIWRKNLTAAITLHAFQNLSVWLGFLGGTTP